MRRVPVWFLTLALIFASGGCGSSAPEAASEPEASASEAPQAVVDPGSGPLVVAFGDSLTAGHGLAPGEGYPEIMREVLAERGVEIRVANEGVSGDTTASALTRLGAAKGLGADWALVELGANDGLRGLPLDAMEDNLRTIVRAFQDAGARVVLIGMRLPPNYGQDYVRDFEAIFPRVAEELGVPLLPFLLEGVAADPALNQSDGIHPNAEGSRRVAETVADFLEPLLK